MGEKARTPVILGGARTPIGRFLGGLSSLAAPELGGLAVRAAIVASSRQVEDHVTAAHLADIKARIQDALDPRRPREED